MFAERDPNTNSLMNILATLCIVTAAGSKLPYYSWQEDSAPDLDQYKLVLDYCDDECTDKFTIIRSSDPAGPTLISNDPQDRVRLHVQADQLDTLVTGDKPEVTVPRSFLDEVAQFTANRRTEYMELALSPNVSSVGIWKLEEEVQLFAWTCKSRLRDTGTLLSVAKPFQPKRILHCGSVVWTRTDGPSLQYSDVERSLLMIHSLWHAEHILTASSGGRIRNSERINRRSPLSKLSPKTIANLGLFSGSSWPFLRQTCRFLYHHLDMRKLLFKDDNYLEQQFRLLKSVHRSPTFLFTRLMHGIGPFKLVSDDIRAYFGMRVLERYSQFNYTALWPYGSMLTWEREQELILLALDSATSAQSVVLTAYPFFDEAYLTQCVLPVLKARWTEVYDELITELSKYERDSEPETLLPYRLAKLFFDIFDHHSDKEQRLAI